MSLHAELASCPRRCTRGHRSHFTWEIPTADNQLRSYDWLCMGGYSSSWYGSLLSPSTSYVRPSLGLLRWVMEMSRMISEHFHRASKKGRSVGRRLSLIWILSCHILATHYVQVSSSTRLQFTSSPSTMCTSSLHTNVTKVMVAGCGMFRRTGSICPALCCSLFAKPARCFITSWRHFQSGMRNYRLGRGLHGSIHHQSIHSNTAPHSQVRTYYACIYGAYWIALLTIHLALVWL